MTRRAGGFLLLLALGLMGSGAARAADPAEGRLVTQRWCSSCHVVNARQGGTDAVPTLESIAKDRSRGPDWVRRWLNDPHPPMPNPNLTRREIDDVVAYLETLSR